MGLPPRDFKSLASSQFRHPGRTKMEDRRWKMEGCCLSPEAKSGKAPAYAVPPRRASPPSIFDLPSSTFHLRSLFVQSGKRDSNPRPQPWQGCALPTELFPRQGEDRNPSRLLQAHHGDERRDEQERATREGRPGEERQVRSEETVSALLTRRSSPGRPSPVARHRSSRRPSPS